jgi:prepilin-type N-terminal cleavage/methylation domain-containing protein
VPRNNRGLTIVELLVVMVLLSILFYYIFKLLEPGLRVWRQSDRKVNLQQNTLVGIYRLKNELRESNQNTVTIRKYDMTTDLMGDCVCFASARNEKGELIIKTGAGSAGDPEWQRYVVYYLDNKSRLRRFATTDYAGYKETDGMHIKIEPRDIAKIDDITRDKVVARFIKVFKADYVPDLKNWRGIINMQLYALYEDPNPRECFGTSLRTSVGVRYDQED